MNWVQINIQVNEEFGYMKIHIFALRWRDEIRRSSQLRKLHRLLQPVGVYPTDTNEPTPLQFYKIQTYPQDPEAVPYVRSYQMQSSSQGKTNNVTCSLFILSKMSL